MAKALGTEIVDFFENGWPDGYYNDESELDIVDGKILPEDAGNLAPSLPLTDKYDLSRFGVIMAEKGGDYREFSYFFNRWKKTKTTATIVIEVPAEKLEAARTSLKQLGFIVK